MTQNIALDAVPPPTTEDTVEAVVVENFETALILYAQRPGFTGLTRHWVNNCGSPQVWNPDERLVYCVTGDDLYIASKLRDDHEGVIMTREN